jgi:hypothetical protein
MLGRVHAAAEYPFSSGGGQMPEMPFRRREEDDVCIF